MRVAAAEAAATDLRNERRESDQGWGIVSSGTVKRELGLHTHESEVDRTGLIFSIRAASLNGREAAPAHWQRCYKRRWDDLPAVCAGYLSSRRCLSEANGRARARATSMQPFARSIGWAAEMVLGASFSPRTGSG